MHNATSNSSDIDSYDTLVTSLADARSDELISNGQIEHARSIIRNLFSHAEKEVRIFTGHLHCDIYKDSKVSNAASAFLAKAGTQLYVLIQDRSKLDESMPFVNLCLANSEQCKIMEVVDTDDQSIKEHMVVMDKNGFRFCPDKDSNAAIASFNVPDAAKNLAKQFDILFARAKEIQLAPIAN